MYDVFVMIAVIIFVLAWYGLTLAGRAVLKPYEKMKVVWCPVVGSFSYVETEECANGTPRLSVQRCLLWPEYRGCKNQCVRTSSTR
jgi:hypothetical protein